MLSSPHWAEDATQEAFISGYRSIRSFRGGSFKSWLFRIGANACYDELRRQRSRPARSLDEPVGEDERTIELPDSGVTPEESAENAEMIIIGSARKKETLGQWRRPGRRRALHGLGERVVNFGLFMNRGKI